MDGPNAQTVLVVDDDPDDVALLRDLFEKINGAAPEITAVDDAEEAARLLRDQDFDVCFLDLRLGEFDGLDILARIKGADISCPVVILTGNGDEVLAARAMRDGAADYLTKRSLDTASLKSALDHALRVRHEESRKRDAELALRLSEARYRDLINRMPMILCELTPEGETLFVNDGVYRITGYRPQDLIGQNWWTVLGAEKVEGQIARVEAAVRAGDVSEFEMALETRNGDAFTVAWNSANRYRQGGDLANIVLIGMDVSERVRLREELRLMAVRDELTSLNNRRGFMTLAEQQLLLAAREKRAMLLLFIDLDGLKSINDQLGHADGDDAIRDMAEIMRRTFRGSDVLARLGGDEFVVLVNETPKFTGDYIQERIRKQISEFNKSADKTYRLQASMGVTRYDPENPATIEALLSEADTLMYQQKQTKRRRNAEAIKVQRG